MSLSCNTIGDDEHKNGSAEDKPLDFSMNSSKEEDEKIAVGETNTKDQIRHVSSTSLIARVNSSSNLNEMIQRVKQNTNSNSNNQKSCDVIPDQPKATHVGNEECTIMKHSNQEELKNNVSSVSKERTSDPVLKQMPPLHFSSTDRTSMASKLLKDIIHLQANQQNMKAKRCLEQQIHAIRERISLEEIQQHNNPKINEAIRWRQSLEIQQHNNQSTKEVKLSKTDHSMIEPKIDYREVLSPTVDATDVTGNKQNALLRRTEENTDLATNLMYNRNAHSKGMFGSSNNALNNQNLQPLSTTVMDTNSLQPDNRQGT